MRKLLNYNSQTVTPEHVNMLQVSSVALLSVILPATVSLPQSLNTLLRPSLLDGNPLRPLAPTSRQQSLLDELLASGRDHGESSVLSS